MEQPLNTKKVLGKIGITKLDTDAIVNAANEGLWEGRGRKDDA